MGGPRETSSEPKRAAPAFPRLVRRGGADTRPIVRGRARSARDIYHWLLATPWWGFAALGAGAYLLANAVFAGLYMVDPRGVAGARPGSFADASSSASRPSARSATA